MSNTLSDDGQRLVRLDVSTQDHVASLTFASHTLSVGAITEFLSLLTTLEEDDSVKAIIIRGSGTDLMTGLDPLEVGEYAQIVSDVDDRVPSLRARLGAADTLFWGVRGLYSRILHCQKVTLLEARGACLDPGLFFALYCDIVIAEDQSRFGNPRWRNVGVADDVSMLISAVGRKRAAELMYGGRSWSAQEALRYGLVDVVVDGSRLTDEIEGLAGSVAGIIRDGIAAEKYLVNASLAKMGISAGFATATVMSSMSSNIHFRTGEFNFLKERKNSGVEEAVVREAKYFEGTE